MPQEKASLPPLLTFTFAYPMGLLCSLAALSLCPYSSVHGAPPSLILASSHCTFKIWFPIQLLQEDPDSSCPQSTHSSHPLLQGTLCSKYSSHGKGPLASAPPLDHTTPQIRGCIQGHKFRGSQGQAAGVTKWSSLFMGQG